LRMALRLAGIGFPDEKSGSLGQKMQVQRKPGGVVPIDRDR